MTPVYGANSMTEHRVQIIIDTTRKGGSLKQAAKMAKMTIVTLTQWLDRGKYLTSLAEKKEQGEEVPLADQEMFAQKMATDEKQQYVSFYQAYLEADGQFQEEMIQYIAGAAPTDWRAAAWHLEKRYPEEFGKAVTVHNTGDVKDLSDAELQALVDQN